MDNLAEQLYRAYCSAAGLAYGSDETPSFHNLPSEQREAWQAVESKARGHLIDNRLVLMSDGPLDETVKRACVVIDLDGHVIKNRYGAITKPSPSAELPTLGSELLAGLVRIARNEAVIVVAKALHGVAQRANDRFVKVDDILQVAAQVLADSEASNG